MTSATRKATPSDSVFRYFLNERCKICLLCGLTANTGDTKHVIRKLQSFGKYYLVFVPKFRKKVLYGKIRKYLGPVFRELARHKQCEIVEGHMVQNHVHMLINIPPKYAVSEIVGYIKGKSAIAVARQFDGRKRNFNGESFWARDYAVSTVGFEEKKIRDYIRNQEQLDGQGVSESGDLR